MTLMATKKRRRSLTPTMRYADDRGNKRTLTYTQYVALAEVAGMWGNGLRHDRTSIKTNTAFALNDAGLIFLDGHYGQWTIQGITELGKRVLADFEVIRAQSDADNL